jgi:hypothetical protein
VHGSWTFVCNQIPSLWDAGTDENVPTFLSPAPRGTHITQDQPPKVSSAYEGGVCAYVVACGEDIGIYLIRWYYPRVLTDGNVQTFLSPPPRGTRITQYQPPKVSSAYEGGVCAYVVACGEDVQIYVRSVLFGSGNCCIATT